MFIRKSKEIAWKLGGHWRKREPFIHLIWPGPRATGAAGVGLAQMDCLADSFQDMLDQAMDSTPESPKSLQ